MIPEEIKAKELIEYFGMWANSYYGTNDGGGDHDDETTRNENGRRIAIQAVEFLMKESNRTEKPVTYWKKVIDILNSKQ